MDPQLISLVILLSIFWFLAYWVLGGVFFAVITILRLGKIRMVRFSCLFTILALLLGVSASYFGIAGVAGRGHYPRKSRKTLGRKEIRVCAACCRLDFKQIFQIAE